MVATSEAVRQPKSRRLTTSISAANVTPQSRHVTNAAWHSISWRSYHLRKPCLRMPEVGSNFSAVDAGGLTVGVVTRTHHRAARGVDEAHAHGLAFEHAELIGVRVARNGQVVLRKLQVLPDGEHVHRVRAQVAQHVEDLLVGLAQPDHESGLGRYAGVARLEIA